MKIGIPNETHPEERRVAATPRTAKNLCKLGFEVTIESGAGETADFPDPLYAEAGVRIVSDTRELWHDADLILKVRPPGTNHELGMYEADLMHDGATLISFLRPAQNGPLVALLASRKITAFAMDCVPRITRAQSMDALSAMANIAGYRAVIEAANVYPRFFAGQVTAAGSSEPAKVLVIGGGVAGLAAIGAARGLGAVVRAFDTRPEVAEQVQSMGADFLHLDFEEEEAAGEGGYGKVMSAAFIEAEMALFAAQAMEVDIIITTALIPGKEAPVLITPGMVESMREGSVIVDLAAEQGGNCSLTQPGKKTVHHGVTIVGYTDLPSRMASQSSRLYGMTLVHFLEELGGADDFKIDHDNEVIRGSLVLEAGEHRWPPPKREPPEPPVVHERPETVDLPVTEPEPVVGAVGKMRGVIWLALAGLGLIGVGMSAPESFLTHFTVFILACFVGWQVIWNVAPALHTPLMSVTNAISGIIIIGGMLHLSGQSTWAPVSFGVAAVFIATINISGGFFVTQRMLAMFRK